MAVSLKPEELFEIGGFQVTNSLLTAVIIALLILLFLAIYTSKITVKPRTRLQLIVESVVLALYDLAKGIMGEKTAKHFFPLVFTFFTLIIVSNWFGLMPFVGSIGYTHTAKEQGKAFPILVYGNAVEKEHDEKSNEEDIAPAIDENSDHAIPRISAEEKETVKTSEETKLHLSRNEEIEKPILRSPSADLNFTLAMALISFFLIQYAGLKALGLEYLGKFFDLRVSIPKGWKIIFLPFTFLINLFMKALELVLELGKIISFTFRLFGNIFAGEVLLFVMTTLTFGIATLPFLGLEIFVGFIQAVVFVFLTMVFIKVASESHHGHAEDANAA
jgi:F-type H+-transporting ATPase subunit a